jgi:hypothetical protein
VWTAIQEWVLDYLHIYYGAGDSARQAIQVEIRAE